MIQEGDIVLFQTIDDGNIIVENGLIQMGGGLDTAVYLSLFGGNEDDSGSDSNPFTFWGNHNEADSANKYISETQNLLQSIPAVSSNLRRIEDAAKRDLNWLLGKNIASSVVITVTVPALNSVKIVATIEAQGLETDFEFVENWKASI